MNNEFGITLIAVANSVKIVLYEAQGIKIIKKLKGFPKIVEKQTRNKLKKSESHYAKKSSPEGTVKLIR
jgi:protein required for attachment to host cells